ncbi:MAG TPA: 30S ribosomal protein S11 [Candidatus Portnoybacteria bacterium]|jgi:small subunit ribosomal protein S11|nr:30S ribosomal protein S11 [Candidatus Portnoybacteria bacterium]MDD5752364.1 30S ribosomal protein S11 [Candidatus Portnoybacteria bacterium]HOZ16620.1 30S ribosomal protein S11 [Candidatus Portnoybacteria bacterium]HPH52170.1 30S ribosomal protein S11 [Candidatus Portnoybacteria bacterium]HPJ80383.1 30S ribosomal protein S11 [Candidatus Portnoybacteria bacterium]
MGKKKIIKETTEEVIKESEVTDAKIKSKKEAKGGRHLDRAKIYVQATYNNTIITMTDMEGEVIATESAGAVGFKGPKKATPFAASRVLESLMNKVNKTGVKEVFVYVKGVGSGREGAIRAIAGNGLDILGIKDITPIPYNGCRPRKPRRV